MRIVNIRDEAVLRELNLHPLWVRRSTPVAEDAASAVQNAASELPESPAEVCPDLPEVLVPALEKSNVKTTELKSDYVGKLSWDELKVQVKDCTACKLRAGCTQTVFGVGDEKAEWLFVGEGPGADEDAQGEPFVGQAGKLLDNMLAAIKLKRGGNVYIANVVKCRPPNNRTPEADEIASCLPYLQQQIAHIKPKLIVALGKTAATSLLGRDATLGSLRGTVHDFHGTPLIVTYHPAYLLRSPSEKAKAWQDLCFAVQQMAG
jgi:DNA polymerase